MPERFFYSSYLSGMSTTLIINIKELIGVREENKLLRGKEISVLDLVKDAFLIIEGGVITAYGKMAEINKEYLKIENKIDASGQFVLPCWCDSHTHLVFAASREEEFIDKIKGLSYADIAAKGGGILNSAKKLNAVSEDELFRSAWSRLKDVSKLGTGSIEIKSGYGLSVEGELKMLRVIKRLKEKSNLSIKATFLGAHAFPIEFKDNHQGYINTLLDEILPVISREKLADYIDVFCEKGFFSTEETKTICLAGKKLGLKPKIHTNQLTTMGGIRTAVELGALSVDHLEVMNEDDIKTLSNSGTIGTLLPSAAFFLRVSYPPARELIDAGCAVALASDYNPGSSPSGNMNLVVAMSCIQMKMLPEEAINAATINGAFAMELEKETGSISLGKRADLIFTKPIPTLAYLPYSFGTNLIDKVMIKGEWA